MSHANKARIASRRSSPPTAHGEPNGPSTSSGEKSNDDRTVLSVSNSRESAQCLPSHAELWKWTMTEEAVASCFAKDVFDMKECGEQGTDFFWLGRVPCRKVRIVGTVVGVTVYEKRTVYSVDDGTAVVECATRHPSQPQPVVNSLTHTGNGSSAKGGTSKASSSSRMDWNSKLADKYRPRRSDKPVSKASIHALPTPPRPVAQVGAPVLVVGRVTKMRDTRMVQADQIAPCASSNEEPMHWLAVCTLYRTTYFATDGEPFVIPEHKPLLPSLSSPDDASPTHTTSNQAGQGTALTEPVTPSRLAILGSNHVVVTPSSIASSYKDIPTHQSPHRLRHPSRLHTRDLTDNTFRIHLKYYMDNAPSEGGTVHLRSATLNDDDDTDESAYSAPETPTKRGTSIQGRRGHHNLGASWNPERTPRQSDKQAKCGHEATPWASGLTENSREFGNADEDESTSQMRGYTLSHLRRVPELALLASRVVDAEAKRRAREERKQLKDLQTHPQNILNKPGPSTSRGNTKEKAGERKGAKMKRLFRHAIRQLYEEGSIVLWDGPVRALPLPSRFSASSSVSLLSTAADHSCSSQGELSFPSLWKNSSHNGDSTVLTIASKLSDTSYRSEVDDEALSDPPLDEEAYIPLTTAHLARAVERVIKEIMARPAPIKPSHSKPSSLTGKPLKGGPTAEEIVASLKRRDGRWDRVGVWAVKEALEWGKERGRVWCIGGGRWEVCG